MKKAEPSSPVGLDGIFADCQCYSLILTVSASNGSIQTAKRGRKASNARPSAYIGTLGRGLRRKSKSLQSKQKALLFGKFQFRISQLFREAVHGIVMILTGSASNGSMTARTSGVRAVVVCVYFVRESSSFCFSSSWAFAAATVARFFSVTDLLGFPSRMPSTISTMPTT